MSVLRNEMGTNFEYSIDQSIVIISSEKQEILKVPVHRFKEMSISLFQEMKANKSSFECPDVELFMQKIHCSSLKAKSSVKSDIRVMIHDFKTGTTPVLGFSIKSRIGRPSTLFNSNKESSNFVYMLSKLLSEKEVQAVNSIASRSKVKDRLQAICNQNVTLSFHKMERTTFNNNLLLIDSALPEILSHIVYLFYTTSDSHLIDLVKKVERLNPIGYDQSEKHEFYSYKIKQLLVDCALGMTSAKVWTGVYDATGGFLVVREDGEVLCYHLYNRNQFEDYILNNTKLETPSTSRHKFGAVFTEDKEQFISLNLQIRFIK